MRIVVAVKYVPDIHAERGFADGRVVRSAEEGTLNELDENALEAALRIIESLPEDERAVSEIVAVTIAGPEADTAVRKAYQLGVDRGVRVSDDALAGSDYFGTARALAAAVRRLAEEAPVDLVITGMAALDGLGSVVPALLAAELGLGQLTLAARLEVADGEARITRELDGVTEELVAPLPAVVSVTDHANSPRFPNFKLIMAARSKTVEEWTLADLGLDPATVGAAGARTHVLAATPRPPRPDVELVVDKGEGGRALAEYLIRNELV
ncbi:electron transfer flavoprotein subunit beta/FixA family protein [Oerskovia flava]|uniref:electron transfer flavoprotein subunit beta/FixA family protein n=1 Tax=Oerskovia flava TaxID=2986422 RepID=UPI00223F98C3|nr:electron transfer flavoprotein subunit beta/FixA family protein [Oerskovia sp. JB1-3-2]